ncbi:4Fe-4S binding protein [Paraburkholderia sp. FT54]|uniref:4Fe-4S binding protein n=1 Tax=Paraburkholderia sp. FT54 TaxID=3074437 RepID=UPI00287796BB|nr:4Fe-4S binding protein [Paraburkholderia sp. FT54]WNC95119.1 4Fe-4S binding protein [Paraburkholderia sp. FT54]
MQRNGKAIRTIQWIVVLVYGALIITPAMMPLPAATAHVWNNLTIFAKFLFWGLWWPFVLLSMVLLGRTWCGVLCPEGTLSEFASKHGRGWAIPRWMRWEGSPFFAFAATAIYGQMLSVHDSSKAALLVLGGSTGSAVLIGYLYGREKRVWCRYLCPVKGVFSLLARLAPLHYRVDEAAWRESYSAGKPGQSVIPVNCAPLVPLRNKKGNAECHMCARCSGHRNAMKLSWRSPSSEVVVLGEQQANGWETGLILYGLLGIAIGAFHWSVSPWFIELQETLTGWLIAHNVLWPLRTNAPWYLLAHYPDGNKMFSWLHGGLGIAYIIGTALVYGTSLLAVLALGARMLGPWRASRLHHLAQALIPLAGIGMFLGSSVATLAILYSEHIEVPWVGHVRLLMLIFANLWSAWLAVRVVRRHSTKPLIQTSALLCFTAALAIADSAWWLLFWHWQGPVG